MIQLAALTLLLCLGLAVPAVTQTAPVRFAAPVISVAGGDTITVLAKDTQQVRIRLYGIACPERGLKFWSRAKQATSDAAFGKTVTVQPLDTDSDGRMLALVFMPGGKSLNEYLLREGMAWVYQKYCTREDICEPFRRLEKAAKLQKRGMWEDKTPVPQQDWLLLPGGGRSSVPGSAPR